MTYREALDWLYSFSDTERSGAFVHDREDNLRRERALLRELGDPHLAYGVTHIAGTKGKGSTAAMLASVLSAAGIRTGLYTQPDLHTFRERIRVNGEVISERAIAALVPRVREALARVGDTQGSYITYEVATALSFLALREAGVRHAVIEVGLGGRLDATNVVEPRVAVITSISFDHMAVLGDTLGAIATEKAGIIKPGVPTVTTARASEALAVFERVATERGSRLVRVAPAGTPAVEFTYRDEGATEEAQWCTVTGPGVTLEHLELGLLGTHQLENAAGAVAATVELRRGGLAVPDDAIRAGLRKARWSARLQRIGCRPAIVVDGAHNADSLAKLGAALRRHFTWRRLILVLGIMADKDRDGMARELAAIHPDLVIVTAAPSPRTLPPRELAAALAAVDPALSVVVTPDVSHALAAARAAALPDDLVCVTGSLYTAGEALRWYAVHSDAAERMAPIEIAGDDH
ncbi:MAG TPA: folylpolyglutamate synthase/dihydrofolate synthase family protein [Ktedonobacterales bacterium]|nr:folylpolyglutamate synthase/dihydrofolate synthase family protein [Ktedonobacterales bacterium]